MWHFHITVEYDVYQHLITLLPIAKIDEWVGADNYMVYISNLYDYEDAWLEIYSELETFCANDVQLDQGVWGDL
jgi:hypothetical protein